jgi:hypothetical protein
MKIFNWLLYKITAGITVGAMPIDFALSSGDSHRIQMIVV